MQQRIVVIDPVFDLVNLPQGVGVQHQIVPVHFGFDVFRRKIQAETWLADGADGKLFDDFRIDDQAAAHDRFTFAYRLHPEDAFSREPVFAAQDALDFEAFFQIVAGQDKLRGFAAVAAAFDATEFGKITAFGQVLGDELVEEVGFQMRRGRPYKCRFFTHFLTMQASKDVS